MQNEPSQNWLNWLGIKLIVNRGVHLAGARRKCCVLLIREKIPSVTAFLEFSLQTAPLLYTNEFTAFRLNNPDFKMPCRYLILRHQRWLPGPIGVNGKWKHRWRQGLVYPVFNSPPNSQFPKNSQLAVKIQITKAGVKWLVIEMVLKERAHMGQWCERGVWWQWWNSRMRQLNMVKEDGGNLTYLGGGHQLVLQSFHGTTPCGHKTKQGNLVLFCGYCLCGQTWFCSCKCAHDIWNLREQKWCLKFKICF